MLNLGVIRYRLYHRDSSDCNSGRFATITARTDSLLSFSRIEKRIFDLLDVVDVQQRVQLISNNAASPLCDFQDASVCPSTTSLDVCCRSCLMIASFASPDPLKANKRLLCTQGHVAHHFQITFGKTFHFPCVFCHVFFACFLPPLPG